MGTESAINTLKNAVIAIGAMAAVALTTLAVITGYKDTGKVDNTTAGYFEDGIVTIGLFISVIVLSIVGVVIYKMYTKK